MIHPGDHYRHEPLDDAATSIRLLKLHPTALEDNLTPICGGLTMVQVSDKPRYHALSYVWGPETPLTTIYIDGRPFNVRQNLYAFLWHYVRSSEQHLLWIDAICINQSDLVEKSSQVTMMGKIFQKARSAIVWLGPPEQAVVNALTLASKDLSLGALDTLRKDVHYLLGDRPPPHVEAFRQLVANPYWSWTWIVQEFVLAKKVHIQYGFTEYLWEDIKAFMMFGDMVNMSTDAHRRDPKAQRTPYLGSPALSTLIQERSRRHDRHGKRSTASLVELIASNRFRRCEDPRDRGYAFRALAPTNDDLGSAIVVDYRISAVELFFRIVSLFHLAQHGEAWKDWELMYEALELELPDSISQESMKASLASPWCSAWLAEEDIIVRAHVAGCVQGSAFALHCPSSRNLDPDQHKSTTADTLHPFKARHYGTRTDTADLSPVPVSLGGLLFVFDGMEGIGFASSGFLRPGLLDVGNLFWAPGASNRRTTVVRGALAPPEDIAVPTYCSQQWAKANDNILSGATYDDEGLLTVSGICSSST